jgi:hypothetical protein
VITKTKFWKIICEELKNQQRSEIATAVVMERIKDTPQNEKRET